MKPKTNKTSIERTPIGELFATRADAIRATGGRRFIDWRGALEKLFVFWQGDPPIGEITNDRLTELKTSLMSEGFSFTYARTVATRIRSIVRLFLPSALICEAHNKGKRTGDPKPGTLWHVFEQEYAPQRLINATPGTILNYEITFRKFNAFLGRECRVSDLRDKTLAAWLRWMIEDGATASTANNNATRLKAVWRFLWERKAVKELPRIRKLKESLPEPDAWDLSEVRAILAAAGRQPGLIGDVPASAWWTAMLLLAYATGLRRGTLLAIEWREINLDTGLLDIPASKFKNRTAKRFILPSFAVDALRSILKPERNLVFTTHWKTNDPLYEQLTEIVSAAGLPASRRAKLHKFRRTTATTIAAHSGLTAAMSMLGHSEAYVTKRYVDQTKLPGFAAKTHVPSPYDN